MRVEDRHTASIWWVATPSLFDPLHSDPRLDELLKK
jgi:hypothetical protein